MTAPELHARLKTARALLADYQRGTPGEGTVTDWQLWALRLADALDTVCGGLWGALDMVENDDWAADQADETGLRNDGGFSIAPGDALTVAAALCDAAAYRSQPDLTIYDPVARTRYQMLAGRIGEQA